MSLIRKLAAPRYDSYCKIWVKERFSEIGETGELGKMNVGILLPSAEGGGVFQYALSIADGLIKYSNKFNYYIIYYDADSLNYLCSLNQSDVNFLFVPLKKRSFIGKINLLFNLTVGRNIFFNERKSEEVSKLKESDIQLMIIPFPSLFGFLNEIPYVVSIVDLMHKYYPSFPEYPLKERIIRDITYKNAVKHSALIIVDDQRGVIDLNRFYKVSKEKIRAIPYMPPGYIYEHKDMDLETAESILAKYNLPERFLFYPAQFWYHKNHLGLIKALKHVKQTHKIKIPVVLVGSPKESYKKIVNFTRESDISDQIVHLGYVSDREIVALYKKAVALVFPSLFGPTNIPPLEAMVLGTPVICSNLFSMPGQVDGAGLLFDPFNVDDMAEKIYTVWADGKLRENLVERGYWKAKDMTLENYAKRWEGIIDEALERINK